MLEIGFLLGQDLAFSAKMVSELKSASVFLVAQTVKNMPKMQGQSWSLGLEDAWREVTLL